jgi:hypothetical protein
MRLDNSMPASTVTETDEVRLIGKIAAISRP